MSQFLLPKKITRYAARFALMGATIVTISGCDLSQNYLKADRSSDMEVQDYRDALAPREVDLSDQAQDSGIPDLKPYMASPSDTLKPMPLVSVSVNQSVPLRDILYQLAEQADYDLELDPRIRGSIIFTARNRPFDEVIEKISKSASLRYKFTDDSVKIELDTPFQEIYKINYLAHARKNTSTISNNVSVVQGEGADTGSQFKSESTSEIDFWKELATNLDQIITANRNAQTLRTDRDPRVTTVAENPAPVEPVVLTADGEIAQGGPTVQVQPREAVLRVEPLPENLEDTAASGNTEDPFAARYSMNRQAGLVSVFANQHVQKQVSKYLDSLKRSVTSQVLIEAKVLEVSLKDEFAAGIDWSTGRLFGDRLGISPGTTGTSIVPSLNPSANPQMNFFASYVSGDFSIAAQALTRFGTVRALASPRLTVLNNQAAVLNVARNEVYITYDIDREEATTNSPAVITYDPTILTVPEGVMINVQPSIDLDNKTISMAVRPTITQIVDYFSDPTPQLFGANIESLIPVVNVQEFDSLLQMNNGQAIVLGGLIQDRANSTQTGVPVLGEIPLVGGLFRNQVDDIRKTELVVFLKATIVEGGNVHNTDKDLYRGFSQDRRPLQL